MWRIVVVQNAARQAHKRISRNCRHKDAPGFTQCFEGYGGPWCNWCGRLDSSCLFNRIYAEPTFSDPFTSKVADIRCVITLISEGRAALVTSYSAFLCMAG
ncbi:hypothetical protein CRE_02643 [Caenorhabditis remanei]|uniref:Uncharacterized protein n=2 Tax=Caenorhabditis remanei TaxID=31234 RepID=E3NG19_CAERE|nr:hypothetical protein CRE_02643 [Caenorhabditis remanei]